MKVPTASKQRYLAGTALAGAAIFLTSSPALADCVPDQAGTSVVCSGVDADGYQTATNNVAIAVQPAAAVGTGAATPSPLLSGGTTSVLNNGGVINSGADAVSLGGASTVNNSDGGTAGAIIGNVLFGDTTGAQVNTFNNRAAGASLTGNLLSTGALDVNSATGTTITGAITSAGPLTVADTGGTIAGAITGSDGADSISITNGGVLTGAVALGAGDDSFNLGAGTTRTGDVALGEGNNVLTNAGTLNGNVTAGAGSDSVTNSGALNGNLALGDGNNMIANSGAITGDITTGAGNDTLTNTAPGTLSGNVDLGTGADAISGLAGAGTVTKAGSGTLTLTGDNSGYANPGAVLSVANGGTVSVGASNNMFTGGVSLDNGTLQTTGAATLVNPITLGAGGGTFDVSAPTTLSGIISGAGGLTKTGTDNLTLAGANTYGGGTTISGGTLTGTTTSLQGDIVDNAALTFDQAVAGTYAGNIGGTGSVTKTNTGTVTLTGNNSYSGATLVNGGVLAVGPTGIGDSSAVTVNAPGTLQLVGDETIGSLAGDGALDGAFTLTAGGNNGSTTFSGPMTIAGLTKVGTGTFNLTGTGTIGTGTAVNGGTLAIGGAYTSPANSVASGATLNVLTPGALTGNVASAAGATTIVNGTVTGNLANAGALSGTGTVGGVLTNTGTLSPGNGDIGIFHVNGAYVQGAAGTLAVQITPNNVAGTGYDQLSVTGAPGTAALGGTLAVNLANGLGTPAGPYVAGTTYDVVRATGGVSGNLAVTGNVLSPFVQLDPTGIVTTAGTTQVYRLTVVRTPYATGIGAGATANEIAVANGFQGLVSGATGANAALVANVDVLNAADARTFFDQVSPESYGAYANSMLNTGNLFSRQLSLQTHETPNMLPGFDLWLRGYGSWNQGRDRDDLFGSKIDTWGITGGGTYRSGGFYAGLAGGYSKDRIRYRGGDSNGHNKSWQAGGYVGYDTGSGFDADLQVDYIHGKITSLRSLNVGGITGNPAADTRAHEWKFVPTVGYGFNLAGLELRPFVGLDHTNGRVNGFTETGAGAADLTVNDISTKRTDLLAGFDLRANPHSTISPYGRIAWRHNLGHQRDTIDAQFDGDAASAFTVDYFATSKNQFDVDAGLNFQASPNFAVFAGYQGTFRKGMDSHGFSAGLSYSFGAPPAPPPAPVAAPPPPPPPPPPPAPPATKACPDGSTVDVDQTCPVPPPPQVAPQGERG